MQRVEKFKLRPGYRSQELLIELCGDHRADGYPDVAAVLSQALEAKSEKHPHFDAVAIALGTDRFFSYWRYAGGAYEIDDDVPGCFILAPADNARVMADVEKALLKSGLFAREDVDFADYA